MGLPTHWGLGAEFAIIQWGLGAGLANSPGFECWFCKSSGAWVWVCQCTRVWVLGLPNQWSLGHGFVDQRGLAGGLKPRRSLHKGHPSRVIPRDSA